MIFKDIFASVTLIRGKNPCKLRHCEIAGLLDDFVHGLKVRDAYPTPLIKLSLSP